jgi:hypothetical protein
MADWLASNIFLSPHHVRRRQQKTRLHSGMVTRTTAIIKPTIRRAYDYVIHQYGLTDQARKSFGSTVAIARWSMLWPAR